MTCRALALALILLVASGPAQAESARDILTTAAFTSSTNGTEIFSSGAYSSVLGLSAWAWFLPSTMT